MPLMLRRSPLTLSIKHRSFAGVLIATELIGYVLVGVLIFEWVGLDATRTFFMTDASIQAASYLVLWSLFALVAALAVLSKLLPKEMRRAELTRGEVSFNAGLLCLSVIILLIGTTLVLHGLGVRHAFLGTLIFGQDLLEVRLLNRYSTSVPTVVMTFHRFLTVCASVIVGLAWKRMGGVNRVVALGVVVYCSSLFGAKGPILWALIGFYLAYLAQLRGYSPLRIGGKLVFAAVLAIVGVFIVSKIQFPHLDIMGFSRFLLIRLGTGQIHGVYEQVALELANERYILHAVPFANYLLDYPVFNKDLMMTTIGAHRRAEEIGVMNSLFVGEAIAIGGYGFAIVSPFVVGLNYIALLGFMYLAARRLFGLRAFEAKTFTLLLVPIMVRFTGDLSGLLLFKWGVMFAFFLVPIWVIQCFLRLGAKSPRKKSVKSLVQAGA